MTLSQFSEATIPFAKAGIEPGIIVLEGSERLQSFWDLIRTQDSISIIRDEGVTVWSLQMNLKPEKVVGLSHWTYTFQEEGLAYGYRNVCTGTFVLNRSAGLPIHQMLIDKYDDNFTPNFSAIMTPFFADINLKTPCPQLRQVENIYYDTGDLPF